LRAEECAQLPRPKLQRLRLGYCAREGCESYFYAVHLEDHSDVDWEAVAEKASNLVTAMKAAAAQEERRQRNRKRPQRMMRFALAFLIMVVLIFSWFVIQHGGLPFGKKAYKYEIDPASAGPTPGR